VNVDAKELADSRQQQQKETTYFHEKSVITYQSTWCHLLQNIAQIFHPLEISLYEYL